MTDTIYSDLAQGFDALATEYDRLYGPGGNAVMDWYRQQNLAILEETFPPASVLLEIGCGTGQEALHLAQRGYQLTATDISPKMIAITRNKAKEAGLDGRITAVTTPAGRLGDLTDEKRFDGAYASFGSLNCEPDLASLATALDRLLRPGGYFICSVMSRFSPFETVWYLSHLQMGKAIRRLRPGWQQATLQRPANGRQPLNVPTRYLSVGQVATAFSPTFTLEKTRSLGLLIPPPYLDHLYRQGGRWWGAMASLERRMSGRWPWRLMGDHLILVLKK